MIYDLHNDFLTGLPVTEHVDYLSRSRKQSADKIIGVIWTSNFKSSDCEFLGKFVSHLDLPSMRRLLCGFAIEDLHFLDSCPMWVLDELPLKYVSLTWNYDNMLAGGAHGNDGLKPLGRRVLKEAAVRKIAVDTAHLNRTSFYDVLESHDGKLLNSHCCFDGVHRHKRNLNDEQIRILIERKGIIGLTLERSFLAKDNAGMSDVVKHIDYFADKFGCDNLCIGSDFNGCTLPDGFDDYASFRFLKIELLKLGFTETDIDKIFYENAAEFFSD